MSDSDGRTSETSATVKRSWVSYVWDKDYDAKSPAERNLVTKIDLGILIYACIGYLVKTLDQANINNAYLSGMKEELGMYGNELNNAVLAFNVPYCILAIPSNILITKIRPSLYLPLLELGWTICTIAKGFVHSPTQLYILSGILGAFEAGYFPAVTYIISSWYTKTEFSKRMTLFATAVYSNLNGSNGLAGWRWLFIVDGLISFVSAIIGFFLIPDFPETTKWRYFTADEIQLASSRLKKDGRDNKVVYNWDLVKRVFGRWHFYLFVPLYAIYNSASTAWTNFSFLLKANGYQVWQINVYPTGVYAVMAVSYLALGWYADARGDRFSVVFFPMAVSAVFVTLLAVWDIPFSLKFASYYLAGVSAPIATTMAYLTAVIDSDAVERTLVIAAMNSASYTIFIIGQIWLWPQTASPRFPVGNRYTAVTLWVGLLVTVAIKILWERDLRRGVVHSAEGTIVKKKADQEGGGGGVVVAEDEPEKKKEDVKA
ncbi:major facilitator superfamily domain-containing protein [Zopfochytrium polystomum]|nr:major facilitator superfamily domain-containing protein [Zopfochytrium polystomum]